MTMCPGEPNCWICGTTDPRFMTAAQHFVTAARLLEEAKTSAPAGRYAASSDRLIEASMHVTLAEIALKVEEGGQSVEEWVRKDRQVRHEAAESRLPRTSP